MLRKIFFVSFLFLIVNSSFAQSIWTAGPMLHVNFGDKKIRASWGLEFAYWNFNNFPYSVDFCAEFEKKKFRLYAEAQTGIGVAGLSAGPVLEFNRLDSKTSLGFQTSVWANYYWGFDFRMRFINGRVFTCP